MTKSLSETVIFIDPEFSRGVGSKDYCDLPGNSSLPGLRVNRFITQVVVVYTHCQLGFVTQIIVFTS